MQTIAEVLRWKGNQEAQIEQLRTEASGMLQLAAELEQNGVSPISTVWKGPASDRYISKGLRLASRIRYHAEVLQLQCSALTEEVYRSAEEEIRQIRIQEELARAGSWTGNTRY